MMYRTGWRAVFHCRDNYVGGFRILPGVDHHDAPHKALIPSRKTFGSPFLFCPHLLDMKNLLVKLNVALSVTGVFGPQYHALVSLAKARRDWVHPCAKYRTLKGLQ